MSPSDPPRTPTRAAVLVAPGDLRMETVLVDAPGPLEVRVRPVAVGLCHSDLHYVDGTHTTDLPEVLGHEAAGVVESVGSMVTGVSPGDHVVTSLTMFCGRCSFCVTGRMSLCSGRAALRSRPRPSLVREDGRPVGVMGGIGAFAGLTVLPETAVVPVPRDLPFATASLFGCAVMTGIGAVTRAADVEVGDTVAVVGCGGIGLAVIQGAALAGASRIVAVDTSAAKLEAAVRFGATDTVLSVPTADGTAEEVRRAVHAAVPGGVTHSFEAVGRAELAELAFELLAPGGTCTVLGMVPDATPLSIRASSLYFDERRLQGAFIGSSRFVTDVPALCTLYRGGRLLLDEMISHRFALDDLPAACDMLASGASLRIVVDVSEG